MPVGFLDPQMLSSSTINKDRSYVVDYVTNALLKYAMMKLIRFAHDIIDHWILVVIIPMLRKALYIDSERSNVHDHNMLKEALNECVLRTFN